MTSFQNLCGHTKIKTLILITFIFSLEILNAQEFEYLWTKTAGNTRIDFGHGIATDESGNCFLSGVFQDAVNFDAVSLNAIGGWDMFLVKYDAAGNVIWAKSGGGAGHDYGFGLVVDAFGDIVVGGGFQQTATFGPITLTCSGTDDVLIVKYDPSGNVLWAKQAGSDVSIPFPHEVGASATLQGSNDYIITGSFLGTAAFGTVSLISAGGLDIFLARYDTDGNVVWAQRTGGINDDGGVYVTTDAAGDILLTGSFMGTAEFDGTTLVSSGDNDIFIAKYDPSGALIWAKQYGGIAEDWGNAIIEDQSGNYLLTGLFRETMDCEGWVLTSAGERDIFLAKLNVNGEILWAKNFGGTGDDIGAHMLLDNAGTCLLTGFFEDAAAFDGFTLTSAGEQDIFIARCDEFGNVIGVTAAGGAAEDYGNGIALDQTGNIFLTGQFEATADFGSETFTSAGRQDIYLCKLSYPGANEKGDVNGDGEINLCDVWRLVRIVSGTPPSATPYEQWAGDGNSDQRLDLCDIIRLLRRIHLGHSVLSKYHSDNTNIGRINLSSPDFTNTGRFAIPIEINYETPITGIQLTISYEPELVQSVVPQFTEPHEDLKLICKDSKDKLTMLIYNTNGTLISPNLSQMVILNIVVKKTIPEKCPVTLKDAFLTNGLGEKIEVQIEPSSFSTPEQVVAAYELGPNFPNPCNPETVITYRLQADAPVRISIYNLIGQEISTLINENKKAGEHKVRWDGRDKNGNWATSGIYLYRLTVGNTVFSRKMSLIK